MKNFIIWLIPTIIALLGLILAFLNSNKRAKSVFSFIMKISIATIFLLSAVGTLSYSLYEEIISTDPLSRKSVATICFYMITIFSYLLAPGLILILRNSKWILRQRD